MRKHPSSPRSSGVGGGVVEQDEDDAAPAATIMPMVKLAEWGLRDAFEVIDQPGNQHVMMGAPGETIGAT